MRLSPHFTLAEFVTSQEAARRSIDNTPAPDVVERLRRTAAGLEAVRIRLGGAPIIVTSGYRSSQLNDAIGGSLIEMVTLNRPEENYSRKAQRIHALTPADLARAAQKVVRPGAMQWVIVGDRAKVEPKLKELGLGEIHVIDADGKPVK